MDQYLKKEKFTWESFIERGEGHNLSVVDKLRCGIGAKVWDAYTADRNIAKREAQEMRQFLRTVDNDVFNTLLLEENFDILDAKFPVAWKGERWKKINDYLMQYNMDISKVRQEIQTGTDNAEASKGEDLITLIMINIHCEDFFQRAKFADEKYNNWRQYGGLGEDYINWSMICN